MRPETRLPRPGKHDVRSFKIEIEFIFIVLSNLTGSRSFRETLMANRQILLYFFFCFRKEFIRANDIRCEFPGMCASAKRKQIIKSHLSLNSKLNIWNSGCVECRVSSVVMTLPFSMPSYVDSRRIRGYLLQRKPKMRQTWIAGRQKKIATNTNRVSHIKQWIWILNHLEYDKR